MHQAIVKARAAYDRGGAVELLRAARRRLGRMIHPKKQPSKTQRTRSNVAKQPASFATVPLNPAVLETFGPYPKLLTFGTGTTEVQRHVRDHGLGTVEPGTQATLLTLVQMASGQAGSRPVQFFDVGAHIGIHSLVVSTVYPRSTVEVTAFEPTPRTSATLRSLAAANRRQIRIERCAISDTDGTADFYISPWESSNSLAQGFREAIDTFTVPTVRLDTYCAQRGVQPDVIKIDVETYESQVLAGAIGILRTARPSVVCEVLPGTEPDAIRATAATLTSCGYRVHLWRRADGWQECSAEDMVAMIPHDGNDWLFTPDPIGHAFGPALAAWRAALAACTADTVVSMPPDRFPSPLPLYGVADARPASGGATRSAGAH